MKLSQLFSAQRVIQQVLDWFQTTKNNAILERLFDSNEDGVVVDWLNNMTIVGKDIDASLNSFFHIKINTGAAYKNGERILISDASILYDATNPSDTTDDGLGNFVSTPHSTGTYNILLTSGVINYVYIAYLLTTDESQFTLHKITNAKQFYKRTDGYEVIINTTGVNPDSNRFIFLGQVNLTSGNQAIAPNISIVNRNLFKSRAKRIGIETSNTGRTDRPTEYTGDVGGSKKYFLDDHIKSVGTGAISSTNPHGLTLGDIGVASGQTVESHRLNEHVNGLVAGTPGTPNPITSAMYAQRIVVSPGNDYIVVKAFLTDEAVIINGIFYGFSIHPSDVTVPFAGDLSGTYNVYFDSVTQTIAKTTASISTDLTKFWLATVSWDGLGDLSVPLDRRRFGTFNRLQRWTTNARPPSPIVGNFGYNMDANKLEYFNGSVWTQLP